AAAARPRARRRRSRRSSARPAARTAGGRRPGSGRSRERWPKSGLRVPDQARAGSLPGRPRPRARRRPFAGNASIAAEGIGAMTALRKEAYGPLGDVARHLALDVLRAGLRALGAPGKEVGRLALIVRRLADGG